MAEPDEFEFFEDIAIFRIDGVRRFTLIPALVTGAIVAVREQGFTKLLIDIGSLTGFDPPSLGMRHEMVREWAEAAQGKVRGVMVAPSWFIDPQKFGIVVARNFGLVAEVFETEIEAMAWLRSLA